MGLVLPIMMPGDGVLKMIQIGLMKSLVLYGPYGFVVSKAHQSLEVLHI